METETFLRKATAKLEEAFLALAEVQELQLEEKPRVFWSKSSLSKLKKRFSKSFAKAESIYQRLLQIGLEEQALRLQIKASELRLRELREEGRKLNAETQRLCEVSPRQKRRA